MKKLSLCLAFCLILTMIPIGTMLAFAEETDSWKLGDTAYSTLDAAIEKAQNGDTIYLTQDLTEAVTVDLKGKNLTINGKPEGATETASIAVTGDAVSALQVSNGTLTLDNLSVSGSGKTTVTSLILGDRANVTLKHVSVTNSQGSAVGVTANANATLYMMDGSSISAPSRNGFELNNDTTAILTLYMYGGSITAKSYGISGNNGTINAYIYGGEITSSGAGTVTGKTDDSITVYGGTFTNTTTNNQVIHSNIPSLLLGGTYKGAATLNGTNSLIQYPEGQTELTLQPVMQTGASIRTNADSWGIRFRSTLPTVWLDYLNTAGIDVTYGTLICPIDVLGETDFTVDNEKVLVNIVAKDGISTDGTNTVLSAALVNLKNGNETRNFAARAYISFAIDGETHTVYSDFSETDHVRSMVQVAQKALADVADTAEGEYTTAVTKWYDADGNLVENSGTKYSCYSETDLEAIWSYVS